MAYEMKDNTGSLFRNDRKEKETHPDYKGQALIAGVSYWVSAWLKTDKNGRKYFSFSYMAKDAQAFAGGEPRKIQNAPNPSQSISQRAMPRRPDPISTGRPRNDDMSDDIPF